MANRGRMISDFLELVKIDSLTRNERQMADALKSRLENMEIEVYEDGAGSSIGGNTGNLICTLKGKSPLPPVLLMAHMDTVVPGIGKKPVMDGNIIRTDGTTILGGDDLAGVECILEALRTILEEGIEHGDIQVVFSVAEEGGLLGAKNLDYSRINARYGFVMDEGGPIGTVAVKAPSQNKITVTLKGKAAHAGVEPEKGISAVQIAAEAVSRMKLGRIDHETTANIGVISGGQVTNIVCDRVDIKAEARSCSESKLEEQTLHMCACFKEAAARFGGSAEIVVENMYRPFTVEESDSIMGILRRAALEAGVELKPEATGGGSDTNIISGKGITAVNVSVGMEKVHSVEERINVDDMVKAAEFLTAVIKNIGNEEANL